MRLFLQLALYQFTTPSHFTEEEKHTQCFHSRRGISNIFGTPQTNAQFYPRADARLTAFFFRVN